MQKIPVQQFMLRIMESVIIIIVTVTVGTTVLQLCKMLLKWGLPPVRNALGKIIKKTFSYIDKDDSVDMIYSAKKGSLKFSMEVYL